MMAGAQAASLDHEKAWGIKTAYHRAARCQEPGLLGQWHALLVQPWTTYLPLAFNTSACVTHLYFGVLL